MLLFRQIKSTDSLECDEKAKQIRANQIWEKKVKAEDANNSDLAAKLDREYKVVEYIKYTYHVEITCIEVNLYLVQCTLKAEQKRAYDY